MTDGLVFGMTKRHQFDVTNWSSVFRRLEELIIANSGADAFEEIFKLIIARLFLNKSSNLSTKGNLKSFLSASELNDTLVKVHSQWPELFTFRTQISQLSDDLVRQSGELLDLVDLTQTSMESFDGAFENLHGRTAKGAKGQFFTPRHVIEACVQILQPNEMELVADTAAGSGGFLIHAFDFMNKSIGVKENRRIQTLNLWGFEFDQRAIDCARALFIFSTGTPGNFIRCDSLAMKSKRDDQLLLTDLSAHVTVEDIMSANIRGFKGFDLILTNPPFAGDMSGSQMTKDYEVAQFGKRVEKDSLFIERNIRLLKPGGRIAIVVPHNKLAGSASEKLRLWITKHLKIIGVLGLGRETFMPHTSQKASIIFGVKRESPRHADQDEKILFLISERSGKNSKGELIKLENLSDSPTSWTQVDHDLSGAVVAMREHAVDLGFNWGH